MLKILFITILTAIGDAFLKKSSESAHPFTEKTFLVGLLIYSCTAFLWTFVYKYMKLSTSAAIYSVFSIIILTSIGLFIFKEQLNHMEIIGLVMAIASLILLARFA